jgi:hypothetical protein
MTIDLVPAGIVAYVAVVVVPLAVRLIDERDRDGRRPRLLVWLRAGTPSRTESLLRLGQA